MDYDSPFFIGILPSWNIPKCFPLAHCGSDVPRDCRGGWAAFGGCKVNFPSPGIPQLPPCWSWFDVSLAQERISALKPGAQRILQKQPLGFCWSVMSTQLRAGCSQSPSWAGQGCYQSCCTTLITRWSKPGLFLCWCLSFEPLISAFPTPERTCLHLPLRPPRIKQIFKKQIFWFPHVLLQGCCHGRIREQH